MLFYHAVRLFLYICSWVFSVVMLGLTAARLNYTTHLPPNDPLNHGRDFFDPIVAELLVTSILTLVWVSWIIYVLIRRVDRGVVSSFAQELLVLFILLIFWLVGAGVASSFWGSLQFCQEFLACRVLTALVAFAWLAWVTLFAAFVLSVLFVIANDAVHRPMHARYDPRLSMFGNPYKTERSGV